jgi:response regulator RpfG family c-di-GMP phosphodiesterase
VLGGSSLDFLVRVAGGLGRGRGALGRARAAGGFLVNARRIFGGVAAHCELAENLARRLGLGPAVRRGLAHALERWDGGGLPAGVSGEAIELPARIVTLARDLEVLHRLSPPEEVRAVVRRRQGSAYDPAVVAAFEHGR